MAPPIGLPRPKRTDWPAGQTQAAVERVPGEPADRRRKGFDNAAVRGGSVRGLEVTRA